MSVRRSAQRLHGNGPVPGKVPLHTSGRTPDPRKEATVELLVILRLFIGLAILAVRYGYDSRDRLRSAEELLGAQGLAWGSQADPNAATKHLIVRPARMALVKLLLQVGNCTDDCSRNGQRGLCHR